MRTRLTELLDIEHPVMLAGMGGVSYHQLVAAVSEAGGIGTLGASTMGDGLAGEMAKVRGRTSKPFGVDLLTALPGQVDAGIEAVIEGGARIFVAGLGVPRDAVDALHDANVLVGSMCGKVRHAVNAVASGCDFVVAQGTEAGGHTGTVATIALVPQVVDAVGDRVPVVAAGGLFDGRGLAAALTLGADGVWVGTRFIATPEARAVDGYKETLIGLPEDGTVISRASRARRAGWCATTGPQHFEEHPEELQPFPAQVAAASRAGVSHLGDHGGHPVDAAARVHAVRAGRRRHRRPDPRRRARRAHGRRGRAGAGPRDGHRRAMSVSGPDRGLAARIDDEWHDEVLPALTEYIRIPNVSQGVRRRVGGQRPHGAGRRPDPRAGARRAHRRAQRRGAPAPGHSRPSSCARSRRPMPCLAARTVLLYGHLDKQPEMAGWREGLGPWTPVHRGRPALRARRRRRRLRRVRRAGRHRVRPGRGHRHARLVVLIEASEESGSPDLPALRRARSPTASARPSSSCASTRAASTTSGCG